jgi:hypothetical protein
MTDKHRSCPEEDETRSALSIDEPDRLKRQRAMAEDILFSEFNRLIRYFPCKFVL